MKKYINKLIYASLALVIASCSLGEFDDEVTTNKNAVSIPLTSNLLTNSLRSLDNTISATTGAIWVQQLAESQYQDGDDNYETTNIDFAGWYSGALADLERIIIMNSEDATKNIAAEFGLNENQIAVAQILQSYYFLWITDNWGMIPYSEALKGLTGSKDLPKYDTQEEIYDDIFATLKAANAMMVGSQDFNLAKGDFLFEGDLTKWKEFANTIRLTMALRLSEANPTKGSTEFNAALNDGLPSSDILYEYPLADENNENAWYSRFRTRTDWCISNTLVDYMQIDTYSDPNTGLTGTMDVIMDPRLPVYANDTENPNTDYVGMTFGVGTAAAAAILDAEVSFLGDAMRGQETPVPIYSQSAILFARAEAALKGWTAEDTQTLYEDAILASLTYYGVEADYAQYMTNSAVAYDGTLEQIITQKWVANYLNGKEAWSDWRRTGFPVLAPAPDAKNVGGQIPVRYPYGTNTASLNTTNYDAAVAAQGVDRLDTPVWWDQ